MAPSPSDIYKLLFVVHALGSPSGGAAERSEAEGVSWVQEQRSVESEHDTVQHAELPPALLRSSTPLKEGGKDLTSNN